MTDTDFQVLLKGAFSSSASSWHEYLCLERESGHWILSRRGYEVLAPLSDFEVRDEDGDFVDYRVPDEINGSQVEGIEGGEYIVGGALVPHDDDSEWELDPAELDEARAWLERHGWHCTPGFEEAWQRIADALRPDPE